MTERDPVHAGPPIFAGACPVRSVERTGALVRLTLAAPAPFRSARAGQFAILSPERPGAPLLGTPLSIANADPLTLLFTVFSDATAMLANAAPDEPIHVIGPLGHPFAVAASADLIVCDVTHFGTLYALAAARARAGAPASLVFVLFGTEPNAAEADLIAAFRPICAAVDTVAPDALEGHLSTIDRAVVAAGARNSVMACVQRIAEAKAWTGEAALQTAMACGVGVCKACVWPTRDGGQLLVCEGPTAPLGQPAFEPAGAA